VIKQETKKMIWIILLFVIISLGFLIFSDYLPIQKIYYQLLLIIEYECMGLGFFIVFILTYIISYSLEYIILFLFSILEMVIKLIP
jgi:hypothetical protein